MKPEGGGKTVSERVTSVEQQNCVQIGQQSNVPRATESQPRAKHAGGRVSSIKVCTWIFACFCGWVNQSKAPLLLNFVSTSAVSPDVASYPAVPGQFGKLIAQS